VTDSVQGGGLVLSFATRANTQDSVSQLSGIIASSPCIHLTKPPLGIVRWLGSRARTIFPNQNVPAGVDSKVRTSPFLP
jgi:acylglycerol lipase